MTNQGIPIYVPPQCGENQDDIWGKAEILAAHLRTEILEGQPAEDALALTYAQDGLTLSGFGLTLRGDLSRMLPRIRPANLKSELLVRAAKFRGEEQLAIDATAGLGEDSLLLAAAGFRVVLYEYNPIIAALLSDSLSRAKNTPGLAEIVSRMEFIEADSITELPKLTNAPDVVLLDPMFPARQKSGLVKKKFQLLQRLELPCSDEAELINAAIAAKPKKIIVKRPPKGANLAGIKPSYSLEAKGIRYDCIVLS